MRFGHIHIIFIFISYYFHIFWHIYFIFFSYFREFLIEAFCVAHASYKESCWDAAVAVAVAVPPPPPFELFYR